MIGDFLPDALPLAALVFGLGCAALVLRLAWAWWAMRGVRAEIARWEKRNAEARRENAYLKGVLAELDATIRIEETGREVDDVAPWQ